MINANELRINNFVNYPDSDGNYRMFKLTSISSNKVTGIFVEWGKENGPIQFGVCLITDLRPIPLIKELLLRFGFEVSWMSGMVLVQLKIINKLRLVRRYSKDLSGELEFDLRYDSISLNTPAVKYLHTLQNLYRPFTGKELIYTP